MHAPYAIFQKYSRTFNNGRNIGLIRAAQTRMGGEAIALQRLLRLQEPLQQTIESTDFIKLKVICFELFIISDFFLEFFVLLIFNIIGKD